MVGTFAKSRMHNAHTESTNTVLNIYSSVVVDGFEIFEPFVCKSDNKLHKTVYFWHFDKLKMFYIDDLGYIIP
jgi:hypothetical protein